MHTQPMADSDGTFNKKIPCHGKCKKCGDNNLSYQVWESSCGGYEDFKYTCDSCGYYWWVDGIDS